MKNIIDKTILFTFYILCFIAFWCLVYDLPCFITSLFTDEKIDANYTFLSFAFCIFILGYVLNYYHKIHADEEHKKSIESLLELRTIDSIHKFDYSKLHNIESISLSGKFLKIFLKNTITLDVPILDFHVIDNQDMLNDLDDFITNQIKSPSESEKILYQYNINNKLLSYLRDVKIKSCS